MAPLGIPQCRKARMPVKETRTPQKRLLLLKVALLGHVQTVQELSDILVADTADLLDIGSALGDVLETLIELLIEGFNTAMRGNVRFR